MDKWCQIYRHAGQYSETTACCCCCCCCCYCYCGGGGGGGGAPASVALLAGAQLSGCYAYDRAAQLQNPGEHLILKSPLTKRLHVMERRADGFLQSK